MAQAAVLENELAPYFTTKAPFQFPIDFRLGFVKYWPIISAVLLAFAVFGLLALFGALGALATLGTVYVASSLFSIVSVVLGLLALPGLFNRKRQGWVFSYYGQLVSIVAAIVGIHLLSLVLGLLFLMLLFQVREYYT